MLHGEVRRWKIEFFDNPNRLGPPLKTEFQSTTRVGIAQFLDRVFHEGLIVSNGSEMDCPLRYIKVSPYAVLSAKCEVLKDED